MYCENCGMELPEWAAFCDRCGARVRVRRRRVDPLERMDFDDASDEPLWTPEDEAQEELPEAPEAYVAEEAADAHGEGAAPGQGETVMMEAPEAGETVLMEAPEDGETVLMKAPEAGETELMDELPEEAPSDEAPADATHDDDRDAREAAADEAPIGQDEASAEDDVPAEEDERASGATGAPAPAHVPQPLRDPLKTIDVGMDDGWYGEPQALGVEARYGRRPGEARPRPYRHVEQEGSPSILVVAGVAVAAIALSLLVAFLVLGGGRHQESEEETQARLVAERAAKAEATEVIGGLDGWWKTGRTFDGRYWHLQTGLMEVYAADGKLASQTLLDPASVDRMEAGPGGIEGAGYYLRDVGFYLVDDDPDTLHAIAQDGDADEDANLFRVDPPAFVAEGGQADDAGQADAAEADESEYLLPEATTRVYDASELEAMSDHDLFVARNEIYARHGYVFEAGELSEYFSTKSWYQPSEVFNEGEISEVERQNVSTILSIEQARGSQYI